MGDIYDTYFPFSADAHIGLTQLSGIIVRDTAGAVNSRVELYDGWLSAPAAPTATDTGVAGNVNVGTHSWKVSFVTVDGETTPSPTSNVVTIAASAKKVNVAIPVSTGRGCIARKVYRRVAGDTGNWLLVGTVYNNTQTTFEDNVADGSLGAAAPSANTSGTLVFVVTIPAANGTESRTLWRPVQMKKPSMQTSDPPRLIVANGTVVGAVFGR